MKIPVFHIPSQSDFCFSLTYWTVVIIVPLKWWRFMEIVDADSAGGTRYIGKTHIAWMLGVGWIFYFFSLLLNVVFYLMHPSSPEMWTCFGTAVEIKEWTPPEETQTQEEGESEKSILIYLIS